MTIPLAGDAVRLYIGDSRHMTELPDESVQMVCTSPPYFRQRKFDVPDITFADGWTGQFGLEDCPERYVAHSMEFLAEVHRVLKKDGVVFWNVNDTYASGKGTCYNPGGGNSSMMIYRKRKLADVYPLDRGNVSELRKSGLKPKDLCLIPFHVARAAQLAGWWVRQDIIWHKKDHPRPESVKDRLTRSHEYVWLFTKSARYFWNAQAISVPSKRPSEVNQIGSRHQRAAVFAEDDPNYRGKDTSTQARHIFRTPPMRNARSVWEISCNGQKGPHPATFPEGLATRCILAGSREGDIVLDPFAGVGTTLRAAVKLGRRGVGYELSEKYHALAVENAGQRLLTT